MTLLAVEHPDWMLDADTITFRSEQHAGVGAEFDCLTRVGPLHTRDVMRIVLSTARTSATLF